MEIKWKQSRTTAPLPGLAEAAAALAVLGSEPRLAIVRRLVRAGEGGVPVGVLQAALGIPASTLSHHLRALVTAGLVEQQRRGRMLICRANFAAIEALAAFLLAECCADATERRRA